MKPVMIVKNVSHEGPGTIEDYLLEKKIGYDILDFSSDREMPDISGYSWLIVMGGPMAVYEMDSYPHLHIEAALIRSFIRNGRFVLGICLGAQMIAYALNARVYAGDNRELGWDVVDITGDGMNDPLFRCLSKGDNPQADVFQWHGDTFDLPEKALCLASSASYPNQAFRYGNGVYALQFHIEVTPEMIGEWFADDEGIDREGLMARTMEIYPMYKERAWKFYDRFFSSQAFGDTRGLSH